jgi:hypothetical protein
MDGRIHLPLIADCLIKLPGNVNAKGVGYSPKGAHNMTEARKLASVAEVDPFIHQLKYLVRPRGTG